MKSVATFAAVSVVLSFLFSTVDAFGTVFRSCRSKMPALMGSADDIDPNFEAHLPSLLKAGQGDRSSPDIGQALRARYKTLEATKRKAAAALKKEPSNIELAIELEELADELAETSEKFVKLAETWDAWSRPSPDLASELRKQAEINKPDPNFEAHLQDFLTRGRSERPDYDLPSELRLLKYKSIGDAKNIAASALRKSDLAENVELAAELEEMAIEIEESHARFQELAATMDAIRKSETSVSKR